jgi:SAM-dependent MidA family methyltransferase
MTPAAEKLAAEIRAAGPISFRRFMEVALYDADFGYYRRPADRDPFGKSGDFFTAEQLQPVFGILIAARVRQLFHDMGEPAGFTVVELGAGRGEMSEAFSAWRYVPVDIAAGCLPDRFTGVVFSNEFFDALPVDVAVLDGAVFRDRLVTVAGDQFAWQTGDAVRPELDDYFRRYYPPAEPGRLYEANLDALRWLDRIATSLDNGYVLSIDYGYTRPESIRFPQGTLMGYRRHTAREDVLSDPGVRDITAHVNFTALEEHGASIGLARDRFETLAQTILTAGESDQFAAAMAADPMQLKTLLFGMGETFRVLLQKQTEPRQ